MCKKELCRKPPCWLIDNNTVFENGRPTVKKEKPGINTAVVQFSHTNPKEKNSPRAERFCPKQTLHRSSMFTFMGTMSEGYEDVSSLSALCYALWGFLDTSISFLAFTSLG